MKLKNQGKGLGGALLLSMFLAPGVVQAKAAKAKDAEANWYVHINRAMMHVNDGFEKDTYFVDNYSKSSRAGITGEKKLDDCLKVGGKVELEFVTASTSAVNQLNRSANNYGASTPANTTEHEGLRVRQVDTWIKGDFGQLSLGHGSMSSWTVVASDLSGTADTIGYTGPWGMAGGVYFHDKASTARVAGVEPTGLTIFSPYDGLARKDRVRYDTPTFAGFMLSGSIASEDNYTPNNGVIKQNKYASDIALRYENRICDVKLLAAISHYRFSKWGEDRNRKVNDASIAALHVPTGLNIALNYATSKFGTDTLAAVPVPAPAPVGTLSQGIDKTQKFQRAQLGLISELNCYGPTNFVVDYAQSKHAFENDAKGKGYGIGVVQQLKKINSEAYVAVRQMKFDRPLVDMHYNKMLAAMVGLRINFGGKLL